MNPYDANALAYMLALGLSVLGYLLLDAQRDARERMRMAVGRGFLILGFVGAIGLWENIRSEVMPRQTVVSPTSIEALRDRDGHFYLTLEVNEVPLRFVVDTGATEIVLPRDSARSIGIDPDRLSFDRQALTANGRIQTAVTRVDTLGLGPFLDRDVEVFVNPSGLEEGLLGMAYLDRFSSVQISGDTMTLTR